MVNISFNSQMLEQQMKEEGSPFCIRSPLLHHIFFSLETSFIYKTLAACTLPSSTYCHCSVCIKIKLFYSKWSSFYWALFLCSINSIIYYTLLVVTEDFFMRLSLTPLHGLRLKDFPELCEANVYNFQCHTCNKVGKCLN